MKIGILGAGQLGRMLALAGYPLGLQFRFLDASAKAPGAELAEIVLADYDDTAALDRFCEGLDCVTYEFENVPVRTADYLNERLPVHPRPEALRVAQDRLLEKQFFADRGIATPGFIAVDELHEFRQAVEKLGLPCVLKTRRFGYDGKGQFVLRNELDVELAWQALVGYPLIVEEFVPFERELSIIAVRGQNGEFVFYPLNQNEHRNGILHRTTSPTPGITTALQEKGESYARRVMEELGYVGVLTIELFERGGDLLVNEMAPRVHNSGHWTIEGSETSQFENHLRAVAGLPLGSAKSRGESIMINLVGSTPPPELVLRLPNAHLHLYNKAPRPGRKLGHVTLNGASLAEIRPQADEVERLLSE